LATSQGVHLSDEEIEDLTARIRKAVEFVGRLEGRKDLKPEVRPIDEGRIEERRGKLESEPTFQEYLHAVSEHSLAEVEIEKLRAFQPNLNLEYVNRLKQQAPRPGDTEELVKFCLPIRDELRGSSALANFNQNTNTLLVVSENLDLRILGSVQGEDPNTGRKFFGFAYGAGLPLMSVVEYKGIYMIKNGYHRAFALLEAGHKWMPCLFLRTENYSATGGAAPGFFSYDLLISSKVPPLGDFSSPAAVESRRPLVRVVASVDAEAPVVPV